MKPSILITGASGGIGRWSPALQMIFKFMPRDETLTCYKPSPKGSTLFQVILRLMYFAPSCPSGPLG